MNIFQQAKAKVPSIDNRKVKAELLYNQLNLFFWCRLAYLILGGILLFIACGEIIADFKWGRKLSGHPDCSPDNRFPCAYGRCLATLVYLRARALGECL